MIELHQFPKTEGYSTSPFCLKVEAYLKMTGQEYIDVFDSPLKAPKKKLPYIVDNGKCVADSALILDYLKKHYGNPLDAHLSLEKHALGHAIVSMLEEKFYFALLFSRWIDEFNWPVAETRFFAEFKGLARLIVPTIVRSKMRKTLHLQGLGRHTKTQIYHFAEKDINSLSALLGEQTYILGERPSSYDASVFGFIDAMFVPFFESPLRKTAVGCENLVEYHKRMRELLTQTKSNKN